MGGNNEFFENFKRNKYLKKLPSMQRVNSSSQLHLVCKNTDKKRLFLVQHRKILNWQFNRFRFGFIRFRLIELLSGKITENDHL